MAIRGNPRATRTAAMVLAGAGALALCSAASAQDVKKEALQPAGAAPIQMMPSAQPAMPGNAADAPLKFDSERHDWGRVTDSGLLEHTFKFTNVTNSTVTIQNVTATCGCTVPQLQQKIYAPGEGGEIKVQFNPTNRRGPQTKQVNVTFQDPPYPAMRLDLSSHVLPMLWVEPNRVLFQDIFRGTGGTQRVVVTARTPDFEVTTVEGMEQNFSARVVETVDAVEEGDPVRKITLEVDLAKDAPIGTHNTQLVFKSNEPKWPEFKIFATAMVVGELKADPPTVMIRTQQPNTPFEVMSIIETRHGVDFDITSVDWNVEGGHDLSFVVDWEDYKPQRGRPTFLLKMSGVTPPVAGSIRATVTVKTSLGEEEQIPVVLWGMVRGQDQQMPRVMPPASDMPTSKPMSVAPTSIAPSSIAPQAPGSK